MDQNDGAFYARPEYESCRAKFRGCTGGQEVRIHCNTEGSDISVCGPCATVWRTNASAQNLYDRCPRCAAWTPAVRSHRESPAAPPILTGPAAEAIEHALHQEGLLLDVRTKVLRRLAQDSPWLQDVAPSSVEYEYKPQWETVNTGSVL